MTLSSVPNHCLAAVATAVGASVVASQLHEDARVPKSCIVGSIVGSAALSAAVSHHGSFSKAPNMYCAAGVGVGLAGLSYAVSAHAELSRVPTKCKIYTALGIAALIGGAAALAKKK